MRLLVNAIGLRAGGGLTVGLGCLRGLRELRPDDEMLALVPAGCGYEQLCAELAIPYASFRRRPGYLAWRLWFDQVEVPARARRWRADVLLTLNNQAALGAGCRQIVLFHNPYYIYPVAEWWRFQSPTELASLLLQRVLFAAVAPRCARVAVQTPLAARRLQHLFGVPAERLAIVPSAIAAEHHDQTSEAGRVLGARMLAAAGGRVGVLTLARYYPHKGLELIVRVAQRLRELGDDRYVFFITVAADEHPRARVLLAAIAARGLADRVVNLGPLGYDQLGAAYAAARVCFLPTILESMSGAHLEALHYRLPIVTTDRDFSRAACGPAARYFSPGNVEDAIRQLHGATLAAHQAPAAERRPAPRSWRDVSADLGAIIDSVHGAHAPRQAARAASAGAHLG